MTSFDDDGMVVENQRALKKGKPWRLVEIMSWAITKDIKDPPWHSRLSWTEGTITWLGDEGTNWKI